MGGRGTPFAGAAGWSSGAPACLQDQEGIQIGAPPKPWLSKLLEDQLDLHSEAILLTSESDALSPNCGRFRPSHPLDDPPGDTAVESRTSAMAVGDEGSCGRASRLVPVVHFACWLRVPSR